MTALEDAPFTVGFAAETENVREYALGKLADKKLDMIVANRVGADCGFDYDDNAAEILWPGGEKAFEKMPKSELAAGLMDVIAARFFEARGGGTQPELSIVSTNPWLSSRGRRSSFPPGWRYTSGTRGSQRCCCLARASATSTGWCSAT